VSNSFFEQPVLNSPYEEPRRHHALDPFGQPLDEPPRAGRRPSQFITPVPQSRNRRGAARQGGLGFDDPTGISSEKQKYDPHPIINEVRALIQAWRRIPNPNDWGVTPTTARLLQHWRSEQFEGPRPFFCQVEAVETVIWLTEVARRRPQAKWIWDHIESANREANPELVRLALKMATGAGKTTVMAMLIAWQALNAARAPSSRAFSRGFLIVTPGITIKDRLRVLQPEDPDNYFRTRDLVPPELLGDIAKAKIVITNYHAFKQREVMEVSKVGRSLLQGRDDPPVTVETEGEMLRRACGDLLALKDVVVINDEAHHCYREKPRSDEEGDLDAEEKREAKENSEAARLWISGVEALTSKVGLRAVYDLSATPFFLRGSGYAEGTLFPWVVSDFSLIDAIESGIVKLPRVPVADNLPTADTPVYRDLWRHIGKRMPKKGAGKAGDIDPLSMPNELQTALYALYGHYEKVQAEWARAGVNVPPVFIVVCNNTATSKLVYEWISGWDRPNADGDPVNQHQGHLDLFRNYDEHGNRIAKPNTLLIDSAQLESGEALDSAFRAMAEPEIEQFRRELRERTGDPRAGEHLTDQELLREVMNTVGKAGRLGESVRCVVSVSMLTEGWDTNTVTHILGVRAFGTQLLCEQVVGRALRRQSYELNDENLFDVEYADILGIPFDFTAKPVVAVVKPPKPTVRVHAVKERSALEITFPRVEGYRSEMPDERIEAHFTDDSRFELNPARVGPCTVLLEGIVGVGNELNADVLDDIRPSTIAFHLAKHILYTRFRDHGEEPPLHLFGQLRTIVRRWVDEGWLVAKGVPLATITYREMAEEAAQRIYLAIHRGADGEKRVKAVLDAYNPKGSSRFVSFNTSKDTWVTDKSKCHVNLVVKDSSWEGELARCIERNPHVRAYVKNQGLGFDVPYRDGAVSRKYLPDFIVQLETAGEPLHLILETKGFRGKDAQAKADTMKTLWVPGVNNLGTFGRWAFAEFRDPFDIQREFEDLVTRVLAEGAAQ
jgi:type III restriction enzyme